VELADIVEKDERASYPNTLFLSFGEVPILSREQV